MILAKLKKETRPQHEHLESRMDVMSDAFTLEDYKKLLGRFYGFYVPLDKKLVSAIERKSIDFDYKPRLKVPQLKEDLSNLGLSDSEIEDLPTCDFTPEIDSAEQVYGCLYVVEGSTLGGQLISRHLARSFELHPANGSSFFSGYGDETGKKWKEFGSSITEFAEKKSKNDKEIISTAAETFETLEKWLFL